MPGVTVTTALRTGPTSPAAPPAATAFYAAPMVTGPVNTAVAVRSLAEFEDTFGTANLDAAAELADYFGEGGALAWVASVFGAAAVKASLTLAATGPADTLTIEAVTPGAAGNGITVEVAAGTTGGTFKLLIDTTLVGGPYVTINNIADGAAAPAAVAASAAAPYVVAIDVTGSALDPAVAAAAPLEGGDDDAAGISTNIAALDVFPEDLGAGVFVAPGLGLNVVAAASASAPSFAILADAITYNSDRRRLTVIPAAFGADVVVADAIDDAATVNAAVAATYPGSDEVAQAAADAFLSFVVVVGPFPLDLAGTFGGTGVGAWAGLRSRALTLDGPARAAAGEVAILKTSTAATLAFDGTTPASLSVAEVDALDTAGIVPFRTMTDRLGTASLRPYGARSLAGTAADWPSYTTRDVVNQAAALADQRAEVLYGRGIDGKGHIFADLGAILAGVGLELAEAGALYPLLDAEGNELDPGYAVDVSAAVNTPATIAAGKVRGTLAIRPTPTGSLVEVVITKVAVGSPI